MYNKTEECRSLCRGAAQNGFAAAFLSTSILMRSVLPLSFALPTKIFNAQQEKKMSKKSEKRGEETKGKVSEGREVYDRQTGL